MGVFVRYLTSLDRCPSFDLLQAATPDCTLTTRADDGSLWEQLTLSFNDGRPITVVERTTDRDLLQEEIEEISEDLESGRPKNAIPWLRSYLSGVRVIYAFQMLRESQTDEGFQRFDKLLGAFLQTTPGLILDDYGISNEEGMDALWFHSGSPNGDPRWVASLVDGNWKKWPLSQTDSKHKAAFRRGELPRELREASDD